MAGLWGANGCILEGSSYTLSAVPTIRRRFLCHKTYLPQTGRDAILRIQPTPGCAPEWRNTDRVTTNQKSFVVPGKEVSGPLFGSWGDHGTLAICQMRLTRENMKNIHQATHNHKRAGAVAVLQSTAELAQVVTSGNDTFWVKLADLTELGAAVESKGSKKESKARRNASPLLTPDPA
jgi:hypothetical protein